MPRLRTLLLALPLALAATAIGACGDDDESASTTAASDSGGSGGRLVVYSGRDEELVGDLFERFERQTGTKLEVRYGDTAELAATLAEEGDRSPADVFFGQDAGALGALQKSGALADIPAPILDRVGEGFKSSQGRWVGTSGRVRVIAYDTRDLDEAEVPDSVFDLTDPGWKGKVGWAPTNGSFQAFVTAMRKVEGDEKTEKWLKNMDANATKAYEGNSQIRDAIAAGEIQLGLVNHYYVFEARAKEGDDYPVDNKFLPGGDVGSLVNVAGGGIVAASDDQERAAALLAYLVSDAGQRYFVEKTFEYPLVEGIQPAAGLPPLDEIEHPDIDLSDLDDLKATLALIESSGIL